MAHEEHLAQLPPGIAYQTLLFVTLSEYNDNNVEFAAAAGTASTYTVTHAFVADKNIATATVDGAVSSSANVTVDANNGTIVVGDVVTGTGISGVVQ